jgi:hypothetical protein
MYLKLRSPGDFPWVLLEKDAIAGKVWLHLNENIH